MARRKQQTLKVSRYIVKPEIRITFWVLIPSFISAIMPVAFQTWRYVNPVRKCSVLRHNLLQSSLRQAMTGFTSVWPQTPHWKAASVKNVKNYSFEAKMLNLCFLACMHFLTSEIIGNVETSLRYDIFKNCPQHLSVLCNAVWLVLHSVHPVPKITAWALACASKLQFFS